MIWFIAKHGVNKFLTMCNVLQAIPATLSTEQRTKLLTVHVTAETESSAALLMHRTDIANMISYSTSKDMQTIIAPPVKECIKCGKSLSTSHSTDVTIYSMKGAHNGKKYTLRCKTCTLMYRYAHYGSSRDGFVYYSCLPLMWDTL